MGIGTWTVVDIVDLQSRNQPESGQKQWRQPNGIDDNGCLEESARGVAVSQKLTYGADNTEEAEDDSIYPPAAPREAMAGADKKC